MNSAVRRLGWIVAVCCVVWVAVLWRWQATGRDVAVPDLVLYLLVLPVVVLALAWALRWAWRAAAAREAARAAASSAGSTGSAGSAALVGGTAAAATPQGSEAERRWAWRLYAAHLNCPCAHDAQALLEAGVKGQPLPALDPQLVNGEGLPVLSTRIAELPLDDLRQTLQALAAPHPSADHARVPGAEPQRDGGVDHCAGAGIDALPEHLLRALAALAPALEQALDSLTDWAAAAPEPSPSPPGVAVRRLRVLLALPLPWTQAQRGLAIAWVRAEIAKRWPGSALAAHVSAQATDGTELWAAADLALLAAARQRDDTRLLLLAAHSDLSDEAIAALEAERRLFVAGQQPRGLIPGEAAAALVLAPPELPPAEPRAGARRRPAARRGGPGSATPDAAAPARPAADTPAPLALVHRAALARRDKAVESSGPVSSQVLGETLEQALRAAAAAPDAVAAVVCDADAHTPRATELFGSTLKALPHLDPAEQLCRLGTVTAHGAAGALLVVAAAAARVAVDSEPCLALALGDSHWRMAVLLRPPPAPADAGGAAVSDPSTATAPEARR